MVLEALFDFGIWLFSFFAEFMPSLQPTLYSAASVLGDFLSLGIWVIGEPIWEFIMFTVNAWITFKCTMGAVVFVYRLIPFV